MKATGNPNGEEGGLQDTHTHGYGNTNLLTSVHLETQENPPWEEGKGDIQGSRVSCQGPTDGVSVHPYWR